MLSSAITVAGEGQKHMTVTAPKMTPKKVKHSSPIEDEPVVIMKDYKEPRPATPAAKRRRSVRFASNVKKGDDHFTPAELSAMAMETTLPLEDQEMVEAATTPDGKNSDTDADDTIQLDLSEEAMEELKEDDKQEPKAGHDGQAGHGGPDTTTPSKDDHPSLPVARADTPVGLVRPMAVHVEAAAASGFKPPKPARRRGLFPPKEESPPRKDKRKILKPKRG